MSCDDVCIDMDDWDIASTEFSRDVIRRARKPHKCGECGDAIAVGDRYQYASGKTEGDMWSFGSCLACVEIRDAFSCGRWVYSALWASIREQLFPRWNEVVAIDCLAKLKTKRAVTKLRAMYARHQAARL